MGPSLDTSSWPEHALETYRYLKDVTTVRENGEKVVHERGGGDEWLKCVHSFMEFQRQAGFPVSTPYTVHQMIHPDSLVTG
jgi:hypothetical protein